MPLRLSRSASARRLFASYSLRCKGVSALLVSLGAMTLPAHHVISWFGRRTFRNLPSWTGWEEKTLSSVLRWVAERRHKNLPSGGWLEASASAVPTAAQLASSLPASPPDYELLASPPPGGVQATWIGHSTSLVQLEGVAFLTDPVFGENNTSSSNKHFLTRAHTAPRCSPFSWLGPLRATPPALDIFQACCPAPKFVLISHAHYDHLCESSVLALHAKFPALRWFVPLGLATWFRSRGISDVTELDWWQTAPVGEGGLTVACTPAQHWSSVRLAPALPSHHRPYPYRLRLEIVVRPQHHAVGVMGGDGREEALLFRGTRHLCIPPSCLVLTPPCSKYRATRATVPCLRRLAPSTGRSAWRPSRLARTSHAASTALPTWTRGRRWRCTPRCAPRRAWPSTGAHGAMLEQLRN